MQCGKATEFLAQVLNANFHQKFLQ